ncbi:MAG: FAD-binding oxidoreductase [Pseudomonadota bacterium]
MSETHVDSWYAATAQPHRQFEVLDESTEADVVIVGGGFTGLSSAVHLRKAGFSVVLLEANRLGWGASGRNGGHVGTGQRADQETLENLLGLDHAKALWDLGLEGVDTVSELVDEHAIACEMKDGNLHAAHSEKIAQELQGEAAHLEAVYSYPHLSYVNRDELQALTSAQGMYGGVIDTRSRHLHPLKYCLGLARVADELGARLFEGSRVTGYVDEERVRVSVEGGPVVQCSKLIIACNGYLERLEPRIASHIMPINNYVLATEPLPETTARRLIRDDASMSDSRFVINYWKLSEDNRLLFGGGESYTRRFPKDIAAFVKPHMLKIYPELEETRIEYAWGGTLAVTMNRMPAFGNVSPAVYYAHGYSGHGVPIATLAGKLLTEAIQGSTDRFNLMASVPSPKFPGGTLLRWPGQVAGMLYYSLRDRFR